MAHELEIMDNGQAAAFFSNNQVPWHGLGTTIEDEAVQSDEALRLAHLDWSVSKQPMKYEVPNPDYNPPEIDDTRLEESGYIESYEESLAAYEVENPEFLYFDIEDKFATVRDSDHRMLGVVGERYKVLQNEEAFAFGDALIDSGDAKWHTAGSLKNGTTTWMLMKLPEDIVIGGMEDERIEQYILISNSHDGSSPITIAVTPVRVVCQNTLSMALRGTQRIYKVRHTNSLEGRLAEARKTLGMTFAYGEEISKLGEKLLSEEMSTGDFHAWMDKFIPLPEEKEMTRTRRKIVGDEIVTVDYEAKNNGYTVRDNQRTEIATLFAKSPNLENVRGTKYAAWQALVEYSDHHKTGKQQKNSMAENRFTRIVGGDKLVQQGFELLV